MYNVLSGILYARGKSQQEKIYPKIVFIPGRKNQAFGLENIKFCPKSTYTRRANTSKLLENSLKKFIFQGSELIIKIYQSESSHTRGKNKTEFDL